MAQPFPIGELFILGFRGFFIPQWLSDFAGRYGLGGVILFDYDFVLQRYERNVISPHQVRSLCREVAALPSRPMVFIDQEGGKVRRLKEEHGFAPLPSAGAFARFSKAEQAHLAETSFAELRQLGVSYNLAPVIDLNFNPSNSDIGAVERSFSSELEAVRENVEIFSRAAETSGIGLCLKHYPGVGSASVNSHDTLTDLSGTIKDSQLALFYDLAPNLPGEAVLVSHGIVDEWDPGVPVSVSGAALEALREKLPNVLLISDDLQMEGLQKTMGTSEACLRGLRGGLDMVVIGNNLKDQAHHVGTFAEMLIRALNTDIVLISRAQQALKRIRERKSRFARG